MTRLPRPRVAVATGVTLAAGAVVLAVGPSAAAGPQTAPLAAPTAPATVVGGTPFTLSGTGCSSPDRTRPAYAVVLTDEAEAAGDLVVGATDLDGDWSVTLAFPPGTSAGVHEIGAVCRGSDAGAATESAYPIVSVTAVR